MSYWPLARAAMKRGRSWPSVTSTLQAVALENSLLRRGLHGQGATGPEHRDPQLRHTGWGRCGRFAGTTCRYERHADNAHSRDDESSSRASFVPTPPRGLSAERYASSRRPHTEINAIDAG